MQSDFMLCNYNKCGIPLTKSAWVTKCSHVFCEEHGKKLVSTRDVKVRCLACKEIKNRDSDFIKTDLNPHEMALACVRPDKALEMLNHASKLWTYQMALKKRISFSKITAKEQEKAVQISRKLQEENRELKRILGEIESKLASLNSELAETRRKLQKYQIAYESLYLSSKRFSNRPAEEETPLDSSAGLFTEPLLDRNEFTSPTLQPERNIFD